MIVKRSRRLAPSCIRNSDWNSHGTSEHENGSLTKLRMGKRRLFYSLRIRFDLYLSTYSCRNPSIRCLHNLGSLELEFSYLSYLTGNATYAEKTKRIRTVLDSLDKPDG